MPVRRTLDQERAAAAWAAVREMTQRDAKLQGEYRALARSFTAMIQLNGLGPACAFLFAKAGADSNKPATSHAFLLEHLQTWLRQRLPVGQQSLMEWLTASSTSSDDYRHATVELLAFLHWLRRFAEGALKAPTVVESGTA